MKKLLGIVLVFVLLCGSAFAETVSVVISDDQGKLVMAGEAVSCSDIDSDGALTLYDALVCAHDLSYDGGAEAGFAAQDQGYGLSMSKLWGIENGGSYGFYVNNASAYSLLDPVADGDTICAYAYTDLEAWSDTFCFFDAAVIETSGAFELALTAQGYDADWNPVHVPVSGAVITANGEDTAFITDAEGKVRIELAAGDYIISARSDEMVLVPPVCRVNVIEAK